ncbi:hypothetical protein J4G57_05325 [Aeromonas caviae]|uniref:hypothetical protein n=1 Tax=Aeromonas TaxID=642 RepID=UPI000F79FE68|nr:MULTISPECIES: hypothetical protein [Aeromonas]MBS4707314.1 hypothetical protein [Aeromonas caviae]RSM32288.1 hypothetical protein C5B78_00980 [Aeromonas salmonicida]
MEQNKVFSMDMLDEIQTRGVEVVYKGFVFFTRMLTSGAVYAYSTNQFKFYNAKSEAERENAMNESTRVVLMNGVVTENGDAFFTKESYKKFIAKADVEAIKRLEETILGLTLSDQEKNESSEQSTQTQESKTDSE